MNIWKTFVFSLLVLFLSSCNNVQEEQLILSKGKIEYEYHENNIGKILFMDKWIQPKDILPHHNLNHVTLVERNEFFIRLLPAYSQIYYLSLLAPELTANELCKSGNWNVKFYVDNQFIYEDNIIAGAGSCFYRNEFSSVGVPLIANKEVFDKHWGAYLWKRFFYKEKNEKLFLDGTHELTIEFSPYLMINNEVKYGDVVAKGSVFISLQEKEVSEQEISVQPIQENTEWKIADQNYNKALLREVNKKVAQGRYKKLTSIVVINNGELMIEEYFNGANRNTMHDTRSVGKSFVGTLMGLAISNGFIKDENEKLNKFYQLDKYKNYSQQKESISIKDLLTMSSLFMGNDIDISSPGNEENMYPTDDWVKFTLDLPIDSSKLTKKKWSYFTAGSVLLGDILNKSVPISLEGFSAEKLFKPLNINNYKWQYTPSGVVNTAGGLQMSSLDLAKFGLLYQQKGKWNNKQIVPESWIKKSTTSIIQREENSEGAYGYLLWCDTLGDNNYAYKVSYATGNGGNKIMIFEDIPIVIIITATAFGDPFGHFQANEIIEDYLLPLIVKTIHE